MNGSKREAAKREMCARLNIETSCKGVSVVELEPEPSAEEEPVISARKTAFLSNSRLFFFSTLRLFVVVFLASLLLSFVGAPLTLIKLRLAASPLHMAVLFLWTSLAPSFFPGFSDS